MSMGCFNGMLWQQVDDMIRPNQNSMPLPFLTVLHLMSVLGVTRGKAQKAIKLTDIH
jgi:hypothetical protein